MEELKKDLFRKAIFETINLWCRSEYEYSEKFKNAFKEWSEKPGYDFQEYSKNYSNFLNDYSIGRTRNKEKTITELIEQFFLKIKNNDEFQPDMVDKLAHYFQNNSYASKHKNQKHAILPKSLVSKTLFLYYPLQAILYDSNTSDAIKLINGKNNIESYAEYFEMFEKLKLAYRDLGKKIISKYLPEIKNKMEAYYKEYFKIFYPTLDAPYKQFEIMDVENYEWLFHRSLDKYLWYYKKPNKK
ncbi:MAG TPA: hypothetical protein PKI01_01940 [Bacteroidales bacterium]|nr:hypothetical protein [Bacteroidales bacterium]